jgi:hypothetical protein
MGRAGPTQVPNADTTLVASLGGVSFSSNATMVLGR